MSFAAREFILVEFREDQIESVIDADGRPFIVIRRICDNLGVDYGSQFRKLQKLHWATIVSMTMVAQDNKQRELAVLPLNQLGGWLFTIQPERVGSVVAREKIKLYQAEAVDVLYRHFFAPAVTPAANGRPAAPAPAQDAILAALETLSGCMQTMRQAQLDTTLQLADAVEVIDTLHDRVVAVDRKVDGVMASQAQSLATLKQLPAPAVPAPPLTLRAATRILVTTYATRTGLDYRQAYNYLYDMTRQRLSYDVKARSRRSGLSHIRQAEFDGKLPQVYALAVELFDLDRDVPKAD